jgi:hypothetical protein
MAIGIGADRFEHELNFMLLDHKDIRLTLVATGDHMNILSSTRSNVQSRRDVTVAWRSVGDAARRVCTIVLAIEAKNSSYFCIKTEA